MCDSIAESAASLLLDWYDAHARDLPWRIRPASRQAGIRPDPYLVWLSEVMLQQTTVAAVIPYFHRFTQRWPDLAALAAADEAEVMAQWAGLGYYARARNMLKCARQLAGQSGGRFPRTETELRALPGVGPYTAAAIAAIAFDQPATVMDGNVERVMARLFAVDTPLPAAKPALKAHAASLTPAVRPGDHAQAVMDLGATICTPRNPSCGICPIAPICAARARGLQADLPVRIPKPARPMRLGHVYITRRSDGAWLLERRPAHGLLGGMLGWPGSDWSDAPRPDPPLAAEWKQVEAEARHVFTHFHLRLRIHVASPDTSAQPRRGAFVPGAEFDPDALPSVMRKAYVLALPALAAE